MVMLTSAAGMAKSAEMLGMAVVRTVPSRNSMKKVAATRSARRGFHAVRVPSGWGELLRAAMRQSCHPPRRSALRVRSADSAFQPTAVVGREQAQGPGTQKAPVRGPGPNAETGGFEPPVE